MGEQSLTVDSPDTQIKNPSYGEIFNRYFPYYLAMGMTADEYWNQDCKLTEGFRKAEMIRQSKMNDEAWWFGMYFYEALCDVSPLFRGMGGGRPHKYRTEPYDLHLDERLNKDIYSKQKREKEKMESMRNYLLGKMNNNNKRYREEGDTVGSTTVGDQK